VGCGFSLLSRSPTFFFIPLCSETTKQPTKNQPGSPPPIVQAQGGCHAPTPSFSPLPMGEREVGVRGVWVVVIEGEWRGGVFALWQAVLSILPHCFLASQKIQCYSNYFADLTYYFSGGPTHVNRLTREFVLRHKVQNGLSTFPSLFRGVITSIR